MTVKKNGNNPTDLESALEVIKILRKEVQVIKRLSSDLMDRLNRKSMLSQAALSKFTDDMIRENNYINRLNAAMERQKIRDYKEIASLMLDMAEKLPKPGSN